MLRKGLCARLLREAGVLREGLRRMRQVQSLLPSRPVRRSEGHSGRRLLRKGLCRSGVLREGLLPGSGVLREARLLRKGLRSEVPQGLRSGVLREGLPGSVRKSLCGSRLLREAGVLRAELRREVP
jgi:hypothetical protein